MTAAGSGQCCQWLGMLHGRAACCRLLADIMAMTDAAKLTDIVCTALSSLTNAACTALPPRRPRAAFGFLPPGAPAGALRRFRPACRLGAAAAESRASAAPLAAVKLLSASHIAGSGWTRNLLILAANFFIGWSSVLKPRRAAVRFTSEFSLFSSALLALLRICTVHGERLCCCNEHAAG